MSRLDKDRFRAILAWRNRAFSELARFVTPPSTSLPSLETDMCKFAQSREYSGTPGLVHYGLKRKLSLSGLSEAKSRLARRRFMRTGGVF